MYNQNFYAWDGGWGGGYSERCLKWGGVVGWRVIKESFLKLLELGMSKDKERRRWS